MCPVHVKCDARRAVFPPVPLRPNMHSASHAAISLACTWRSGLTAGGAPQVFALSEIICWGTSMPIMPMPRQVGVDLALEAPMEAVRAKSLALGDLLIRLISQRCPAGHGLRLVSPADPAQRGSQLCFAHPEAYGIVQASARQATGLYSLIPDMILLPERLCRLFSQPHCPLTCDLRNDGGAVQVAVRQR